jgi:hypothetical protein
MRYVALLLYLVMVAGGYVLCVAADLVSWLYQRMTCMLRRYHGWLDEVYEWTL